MVPPTETLAGLHRKSLEVPPARSLVGPPIQSLGCRRIRSLTLSVKTLEHPHRKNLEGSPTGNLEVPLLRRTLEDPLRETLDPQVPIKSQGRATRHLTCGTAPTRDHRPGEPGVGGVPREDPPWDQIIDRRPPGVPPGEMGPGNPQKSVGEDPKTGLSWTSPTTMSHPMGQDPPGALIQTSSLTPARRWNRNPRRNCPTKIRKLIPNRSQNQNRSQSLNQSLNQSQSQSRSQSRNQSQTSSRGLPEDHLQWDSDPGMDLMATTRLQTTTGMALSKAASPGPPMTTTTTVARPSTGPPGPHTPGACPI